MLNNNKLLNKKNSIFVSSETFKNLNLDLIWKEIIPLSIFGQKKKKNLKPFLNGMELEASNEFTLVNYLLEICKNSTQFYKNILEIFSHFQEINLILEKINKNKTLEIFELQEIKSFIYFYQRFQKVIAEFNLFDTFFFPDLTEIYRLLDPENQNSPVFFLSDNYDENFAEKRKKLFSHKKKKKSEHNRLLQEASYNLNFESTIEKIVVSRYDKELVNRLQSSSFYHLESENFANLHFSISKNSDIIDLEKEINSLYSDLMVLENLIRENLTKEICKYHKILLKVRDEIACFDWLLSKAYFGFKNNCCIPKINTENKIEIESSCNIPVYLKLKKDNIDFQKIDLFFSKKLNIITGSNMAGKTTILKTVGQILFMGALSIPVPALKAEIPLVDSIFFSGIQANRMDLSSFGSEIVSLNNALSHEGFSLFLVDELARGTNPQEGEAFSKAILEHFSQMNCIVLFSTHFNNSSKTVNADHYQIAGLSQKDYLKLHLDGFHDLTKRLEELHKFMDYRLLRIDKDAKAPQAALMIAQILGIDKEIIDSAKKYLN